MNALDSMLASASLLSTNVAERLPVSDGDMGRLSVTKGGGV